LLLTAVLLDDRYLLSAGHTAANLPHAAAAVGSCDRQTDGQIQTDTIPLHRPCSAYYVGSASNKKKSNFPSQHPELLETRLTTSAARCLLLLTQTE